MCNISKETIMRANRRTCKVPRMATIHSNTIMVSTRCYGVVISQSISLETIRDNYGKALERSL